MAAHRLIEVLWYSAWANDRSVCPRRAGRGMGNGTMGLENPSLTICAGDDLPSYKTFRTGFQIPSGVARTSAFQPADVLLEFLSSPLPTKLINSKNCKTEDRQ